MTISILGAGSIGTAIAGLLTRNGIAVSIANSRGPDTLSALVTRLGDKLTAVTAEQALKADLVFVAVNWSKLPAALKNAGPWQGRIVIDTNNPIEAPTFKAVDLAGRSSSSVVAELVPGARLVKAFNHLTAAVLGAEPDAEGGKRVLFFSGDDTEAKATVAALINQLGFFGVDLGTVEGGGRLAQFPGGALPALNLVKF